MPRTRAQTDTAGEVRMPAKYSQAVMDVIAGELEMMPEVRTIFDPFGGIGGVHDLRALGYETFAIELEREWQRQSRWTARLDVLSLPTVRNWRDVFGDRDPHAPFDAIVTSPTYGNRMADSHNNQDPCRNCGGTGHVEQEVNDSDRCRACDGLGTSRRNTYTHALGRALHESNSGGMQWGDEYRSFHVLAWNRVVRVLKPSGYFLLNISDHIRNHHRQRVVGFHVGVLNDCGLIVRDIVPVLTPRNRNGANASVRTSHEMVVVLQKPERP